MATGPNRRIDKLVTRVVMPHSLAEPQRAKLERAAHTCPVHGSLRPDIEMPIEFVYP